MFFASNMCVQIGLAQGGQVADFTLDEDITLVFFVGVKWLDFSRFGFNVIFIQRWIAKNSSDVFAFRQSFLFFLKCRKVDSLELKFFSGFGGILRN